MRITCQDDLNRGVDYLKHSDPRLQPLFAELDRIPLRLGNAGFTGLAEIIVSQQVSKASADAIFGRLCTMVDPLTPSAFLNAGEDTWRAAGLSRPKQSTLVAVGQAIENGHLDLETLCALGMDDAIAQMTTIKGIGPWTAEVYLMFCAGHADVFPAGDLALQEAIRLGFGLDERPSEKDCRGIAGDWAPWRSVAARVLWAYYGKRKRQAMPIGAHSE